MALANFSDLKTSIADHLDRDDLTSHIPDFILLAEERHKNEIRIREMIQRDALTVNARYVSLPAGYLDGLTLRLLTDPVTVLTEVNLHEMSSRRSEGTGKPVYYTIHAQFEFDKTPDQSYSGEIVYYKALTALSDAAPTNDLLTRAPATYLYGALAAAAPFLMNDERLTIWERLYETAKDGVNLSSRKSRNIGPVFSRISGSTP